MLHVGFDIGGTNIAVGVVNDDMQIIARRSVPFPTGELYQQTAALMAEQVVALAVELKIAPDEFTSIGVVVPGSIDPACERVIHAYNLQFHDVPLRAAVQEHFPKVPVFLANDADGAALAELYAGAFRGCKTAVLFTLGTGIGGGLILGGRMFSGGMGHGVELGHMILSHKGPMCTCGNKGCIEAICAASWLVQQGRRSIVEYPNGRICTEAGGNMDKVSAKLVIDCAKAGDAIAKNIFNQYVDALGDAVASIMSLLDPEVVAIGGGVSAAGDFLFKPLRRRVDESCFFEGHGTVVPAQMGNDAGIVGAAMLYNNSK